MLRVPNIWLRSAPTGRSCCASAWWARRGTWSTWSSSPRWSTPRTGTTRRRRGAFVVAWTNNFVLNKFWTFQRHGLSGAQQGARYLAVSLVALGLNLIVLELLVSAGSPEVLGPGGRDRVRHAGQLPAEPPLVLPVGRMSRRAVALLAALALAAFAACASAAEGAAAPRAVEPTPAEATRRGRRPGRRGSRAKAAEIRTAAAAGPARKASLTDHGGRGDRRDLGELRDWVDDWEIARTAVEFDPQKRQHTYYAVSRTRRGRRPSRPRSSSPTRRGEITEVRTGPQVAWMMARGYEGAFGRPITRPAVWIPLCLIFLVALLPFLRPRRLLSWRTLDLLVLLSFWISLIWFNDGEIFTSVPLQYPPMVYLGLRLAWIAVARTRAARPPRARRADDGEDDRPPPRPRPRSAARPRRGCS